MTTFDDRENAFEAHFVFEETLEFRVHAARDRLLAAWAGGLMGISGEALDAYTASVVRADLRSPGDEDVYTKVMADLSAKGAETTPQEVREQMERFLLEAREQLGSDSHLDRVV